MINNQDYKRETYKRNCSICGQHFETVYKRQNICSFKCRQEGLRINGRKIKSRNLVRYGKKVENKCEICGFNLTTDIHHEGKRLYELCPNHHALITRGIMTIQQVLELKKNDHDESTKVVRVINNSKRAKESLRYELNSIRRQLIRITSKL